MAFSAQNSMFYNDTKDRKQSLYSWLRQVKTHNSRLTVLLSTNMCGRYTLEKILLQKVDHTCGTLTVAIAFLSSFRALRTVNSLAWPSVCWRLYLLRFSKHALWDELLAMHLSLRLNNVCCMLSRLEGGYAVDFFAKPLLQYPELLMHTWSQELVLELSMWCKVQTHCKLMGLHKETISFALPGLIYRKHQTNAGFAAYKQWQGAGHSALPLLTGGHRILVLYHGIVSDSKQHAMYVSAC
jgi:hypothetical protein